MSLQRSFSSFLEQELKKRKAKNGSYSIRAFAKHLGVDQSSLSKFLQRKRNLSIETIEKCLNQLMVDDQTREYFLGDAVKMDGRYSEIEDSMLAVLSDWKYWAILEYLKIDANPDVQKMSDNLGLKETVITTCLETLINLKFLDYKEGSGYMLLKPNNYWHSSTKTSEARKRLQKKYLEMSMNALDEVPVDLRQHGSLTVAIDPGRIPELKEKINEFQTEFGNFSQEKGQLRNVYQLTVSFFPITKVVQ